MIVAENLVKSYGAVKILHGVSLSVAAGERIVPLRTIRIWQVNAGPLVEWFGAEAAR
ncbi:hypothetical protein [Mesorhizobium caraganae]|uniref:hypothetical protein n=1 Tax=Mesorhizobium caraganae TaxID=483206 RepID=UPI0035E3CCC1